MKSFRRAPALVLALASFLTQLDVTAVIVAMPSIGGDLGFGVAGYAWVMDAYSLAFTGTLLAAGALADRHGRRRALLLGNVAFAVASLTCALAWDGPSLWASRAVQGAASAFVVTGSIALIAGAYPDPEARARAFGLAGIVSGMAMAIGPTLGGAVAQWFGWRWIFLANLPACALAAWMVPRLIAETRDEAGRPLDLLGIGLLTLALGLAVEALLQQAHRPLALLALELAASGFVFALFIAQQRRRARPVLDPALLKQPAMIAAAILLVTVSVAYWAVLVYLPLFLGAGFGFAAETVGIAMLAATLPMLVLPPVAGALVPRWGWRRLFATGLIVVAAGDLVLAATFIAGALVSPLWIALLGMSCIATGAALVQSQLSGAVVALAPPAQAGMASALTIVMRQGGFALGIAALGAALGTDVAVGGFSLVFWLAAIAAVVGAGAALLLLPEPKSLV